MILSDSDPVFKWFQVRIQEKANYYTFRPDADPRSEISTF